MNKYETVNLRALALVIDILVITAANTFIEAIHLDEVIGSNSIFVMMLPYLYMIVATGKYGQTIGKKLINIKVVDFKSEGSVSMAQSFKRESVPTMLLLVSWFFTFLFKGSNSAWFINLSALPFVLYIGWCIAEMTSMKIDPRGRTINDKLAGTIVINTASKSDDTSR